MRMTTESKGLRRPNRIWSLLALPDGTVVSGDSMGKVVFWDGSSGAMSQTFDHNESGADVLSLACDRDGDRVFASGIDSRVACIQRQGPVQDTRVGNHAQNNGGPAPLRKWIATHAHRQHSHDVTALVVCVTSDLQGGGGYGAATPSGDKSSSDMPSSREVLVSGSADSKLCTYDVRDFRGDHRPKSWYDWPTRSPVSLSRDERLLAAMRPDKIDLYGLSGGGGAAPNSSSATTTTSSVVVGTAKTVKSEANPENFLVRTISIQSPHNLTCSVVSECGRFLAASDAGALYLFQLDCRVENGVRIVEPSKMKLPKGCKGPCTAVCFDNDGGGTRLFGAAASGPIRVLRIQDDKVSLEHVFEEHTEGVSATSYHFPVTTLDASADGKWLAAGRHSIGKGAVHVFALKRSIDGEDDKMEEGENDGKSGDAEGGNSYRHWWAPPSMEAPTTCVKFLGGAAGSEVDSSLAAGCSNNSFYIFNLDRRELSHWSQDVGCPIAESVPEELTKQREAVNRFAWNPATPNQFLMGAHGFFCAIDLDHPVPEASEIFPPTHLRKKRKRGPSSGTNGHAKNNFAICLRYSGMIFSDFVAENEMVIVEQPWLSVQEGLPDALARRVYGK